MTSAPEQWTKVSTRRTIDVVQDILETLMFPNLFDDLRYRVCDQNQYHNPHVGKLHYALKMTPMRVNMINCEITKNAK